jgi:hypothetical protein
MKKCYAKKYTESMVFHGALVCWGGFGSKPCKFLVACVEQYVGEIPTRTFNLAMKKARKLGGLK